MPSSNKTRRALSALPTLIVAAGLCLAATMLVPLALGFERYVVSGDSMSGSYDRGSLLFSQEVPVAELRVGDVITYAPPVGSGPDGLITHRITSIRNAGGGSPIYRTAGDANASPDPWRFQLDQPTQARASFSVPYLGYAFAALSVRELRMLVIGLPALLLAFALVAKMWRDAGVEASRVRQAADSALSDGGAA